MRYPVIWKKYYFTLFGSDYWGVISRLTWIVVNYEVWRGVSLAALWIGLTINKFSTSGSVALPPLDRPDLTACISPTPLDRPPHRSQIKIAPRPPLLLLDNNIYSRNPRGCAFSTSCFHSSSMFTYLRVNNIRPRVGKLTYITVKTKLPFQRFCTLFWMWN